MYNRKTVPVACRCMVCGDVELDDLPMPLSFGLTLGFKCLGCESKDQVKVYLRDLPSGSRHLIATIRRVKAVVSITMHGEWQRALSGPKRLEWARSMRE